MRNWVVPLLVALGFGCSAHYPESPTPAPILSALDLQYNGVYDGLNPGQAMNLILYAVNSDGAYEVVTSGATWLSSNTTVATVTNGLVRAAAVGTADVTASYLDHTATARIVVLGATQYPLLDIVSFSVPEPGKTDRVIVRYSERASGASRDVSAEATWSSSNPRVFTVEAAQITARAPGTAMLMATFNGTQAFAYVSVPPMRRLP